MKCIVRNITALINSQPFFSLSCISFALSGGEILSIVGESGSGKTSLLDVLAGFIPIQHGVVILDNETVSCASYSLPPVKRNVGYIFQDQNLRSFLGGDIFDKLNFASLFISIKRYGYQIQPHQLRQLWVEHLVIKSASF